MRLTSLLSFGVGVSLLFCSSVSGAAVTSLDAASFDSFITSNEVSLVEFFAPWCGHCKKLAPEYETAATALAESNPNIKLAAVDCTTDKDLCSDFDVNGFPTLKIFRGSRSAIAEYGGGRTANDIVKYMKKQTEPAYVVVSTADELTAATSAVTDGVLIAGVFASLDSPDALSFIELANTLRNEHSFILSSDLALIQTAAPSAASPSVVLFKRDGELQSVVSAGPFDVSSLSAFIKAESFPALGEIGPENFQKYMERGFPLVWIFVDLTSPLTEATLALARAVGATASVKSSLSLVYLDGVKWADHAKHFGLNSGELPGVVLEDREASKNYIFPFAETLTEESFAAWLARYSAGTLSANVKSQEPPANNNGPVTTIVGKTFDSIVLDDTKDVLVEFYAPWCGHCKSLAPKWEALGKIFAKNDNVIIGQVDATENDTPAKIKGFPTIILYKAGDKSNAVTYEGERTETAIAAWLRQNGNTFTGAAEETAAEAHDHDDHSGHSHDDL